MIKHYVKKRILIGSLLPYVYNCHNTIKKNIYKLRLVSKFDVRREDMDLLMV